MAETRAIQELTPEIWDDQFTVETYQTNPFAAYAGTGSNNPIVMKEDFASQRGNGISFEFISQLEEGAITGRAPLKGNEDVLGEYGDKVFWDRRKRAISMHEVDEGLAAIDLRRASRQVLRDWADNDIKHQVIRRLLDVGADCDVDYTTASAAQKNTWNQRNSDRVLYGSAVSNYDPTHSTALAAINNTADQGKLGKTALGIMKRLALLANPKITPIRVEQRSNRRFFVAAMHPFTFRDVVASLESVEAQVSVVERNEGIFLGGDREYDGIILHEVDDMPLIEGVGADGIDVAPVYFFGQEALGWGIKKRYASRTQKDDYDQITGLGMIGDWGMKKLCWRYGPNAAFHGKQRGMVTGFFAAVAD